MALFRLFGGIDRLTLIYRYSIKPRSAMGQSGQFLGILIGRLFRRSVEVVHHCFRAQLVTQGCLQELVEIAIQDTARV